MAIFDFLNLSKAALPTEQRLDLAPLDTKAAYDLQRVGVQGRPQYPDTNVETLQRAYRTNEMVYASIHRKASAAIGPRQLVQGRSGDSEWSEVQGHPYRRLMMRPNPRMTEAGFYKAWIVSCDVAGEFYAEIVRGPNGLPVQLWPLDPAKTFPIPGDNDTIDYEFRQGYNKVRIPGKDMLVYRNYDLTNRYHGLSPLAVAMGSVDADSAQTDFIREFFNNAGVPSGLLKYLGGVLTQEKSDAIKAQWETKYGRASGNLHRLAVLDANAEYQKIGSGLNELQSQDVRAFSESRISMVFDVPPLIVYSYVGLLRATYSNLKEAWRGFWDATLTPMFTEFSTWLTWNLLNQFVSEDLLYGERIRLEWDWGKVVWLAEDLTELQARARENFAAGGITVNEFRAIIGEQPDPKGDYYVRLIKSGPVLFGETPVVQAPAGGVQLPAKDLQLPPGVHIRTLPSGTKGKASRARIEARIEREMAALIKSHYDRVAAHVEAA
jgi:HK97 family phage portal protein